MSENEYTSAMGFATNSSIVSHDQDDYAMDNLAFDDLVNNSLNIIELPSDLAADIDMAGSIHSAERFCIDYVVDQYERSDRADEEITQDEFDTLVQNLIHLFSAAVNYHNGVPGNDTWQSHDNLTRKQMALLSESIPVREVLDFDRVVEDITKEKIAEYKRKHPNYITNVSSSIGSNANKNIRALVDDILWAVAKKVEEHNKKAKPGQKWKALTELRNAQVVDIIDAIYPVKAVITCDTANPDFIEKSLLLCIYISDTTDEFHGIYSCSEDIIKGIIKQLKYNATTNDMKDVMNQLRFTVPKVKRSIEKNLIAVGNGIFDYTEKTLLPFSPEHVFLSKSSVNYVANAENPVLRYLEDGTDTGEDWNVEDWMSSLSDDPEIVELLWKIIGAIIRPNNRWNKAAWLISESGNSGKGTLCELMRNICGYAYAAIPLADFSKDFMLTPLLRASAIIVDENDVGDFIDKAGNLKAVITNDVICINRKYMDPISYQFRGFSVQCLNGYPRVKDKSGSFYRRQLFIPLTKCFTGMEKKYIKDEFMHNEKVLEYVLHKVLNMNYYTLDEPSASKTKMAEYKEFNDPVRSFFNDVRLRLVWNKLPYEFLFELYKAWMKRINPSGQVIGRDQFIRDIREIIRDDDIWTEPENKEKNFRIPKNQLYTVEPLASEYRVYWSAAARPYQGIVRHNIEEIEFQQRLDQYLLEQERQEMMYEDKIQDMIEAYIEREEAAQTPKHPEPEPPKPQKTVYVAPCMSPAMGYTCNASCTKDVCPFPNLCNSGKKAQHVAPLPEALRYFKD